MCFAGETPSGVIVLESAVRQYEDVLGIRHPGISTLSKKAEKLLSNLEPEQREEVCCNHDVCYTAPTCKSGTVMHYGSDTVGSDAVPSCVMLCCGGMLCCCVTLCCRAMLCCAMLSLLTAPNEHGTILHT